MALKVAHQAAQHAIGVTERYHQRRDQGVGAANGDFRIFRAHALASHERVVTLPVGAVTRVILGVDDFDVFTDLHAQARFFDTGFNNGRAPHQDGHSQVFVHGLLAGAQGTLFFAFSDCDALVRRFGDLGCVENGLHQDTRLVDETF